MNEWDRAGIKLETPGSAVGLATDCATGPGSGRYLVSFNDGCKECIVALLNL